MGLFWVKKGIAAVFQLVGANQLLFSRINRRLKNDYIRVINYHSTPMEDAGAFEKQLNWYRQRFSNIDGPALENYLRGGVSSLQEGHPGLLLTFDDGYSDNYTVAKPLLEKYGFTGCFFVSSDLVGTDGYMTQEQLQDLADSGHIVGCHTASHWRVNEEDSEEKLHYEIAESKRTLEQMLGREVGWFAWCGGEEKHYTAKAAELIRKAGYSCSFMTNSSPVTQDTDRYQLERTNIEAAWDMALVCFQISGWMDIKSKAKKLRVEALTAQ